MTEPVLEVEDLTRRFGGLIAVDGVSLSVAHGRTHAVIGPNGAGKSTLIALLSGDLRPSSGKIRLGGDDVTGLPADRIARRGVGRSYQKTNIFKEFTAFENCRLAAQARRKSSMRFFRPALAHRDINEAAARALDLAELGRRADTPSFALSHGEQRQLEIAMALATGPRLLLLDEPLAGMGAEEAERMVMLLKRLAPDHAIVLVEHDMDAVFSLADRLTVMVNGRLLASGTPAEIRADTAVQEAYLGTPEPATPEEGAGHG